MDTSAQLLKCDKIMVQNTITKNISNKIYKGAPPHRESANRVLGSSVRITMTILLVVFTEFIAHLDPSIDEGRRFEKEYFSECPTAEECRKEIAEKYNDFILPAHVRIFIDFKQLKRTKEKQADRSPLIIDVVAETAAIHAFREEIDYWKGGKGCKGMGWYGPPYGKGKSDHFHPYGKGKASYQAKQRPHTLTIIVKFQRKNRRLTWMGVPERHVGGCNFTGWWDTTKKQCSVDHTDFKLEVQNNTAAFKASLLDWENTRDTWIGSNGGTEKDFIAAVSSKPQGNVLKTIYVHSVVLKTHSIVFQRMLETDMKEKHTGKVVIDISESSLNMSVFDISCVVEWMYCGTVTKPDPIMTFDAAKMAYFARFYEMDALKAACIEQILHHLPESKFVRDCSECVQEIGNAADCTRCMCLLMQNRHLMQFWFGPY